MSIIIAQGRAASGALRLVAIPNNSAAQRFSPYRGKRPQFNVRQEADRRSNGHGGNGHGSNGSNGHGNGSMTDLN